MADCCFAGKEFLKSQMRALCSKGARLVRLGISTPLPRTVHMHGSASHRTGTSILDLLLTVHSEEGMQGCIAR